MLKTATSGRKMLHTIGNFFSAYRPSIVSKVAYFGQFVSVFEHISVSFWVAFVLAVSRHVRSAYVTSFTDA